jgi:hypothetical protein
MGNVKSWWTLGACFYILAPGPAYPWVCWCRWLSQYSCPVLDREDDVAWVFSRLTSSCSIALPQGWLWSLRYEQGALCHRQETRALVHDLVCVCRTRFTAWITFRSRGAMQKKQEKWFFLHYSMIFHTKFWRIFFFTLMFFECIRDFSPSYFIDSFTGASVQLRNRGKKRKWLGSVPISFSGDIK